MWVLWSRERVQMIGGDVACVYGEQSPCVFPSLDSHPQLICNRGGAQKWVRQFARRLSTFSSIRSTKIPNFAHLYLHWSVLILQFILSFSHISPTSSIHGRQCKWRGWFHPQQLCSFGDFKGLGYEYHGPAGALGGCRYWYRDSTAIRWFEMQSTYIYITHQNTSIDRGTDAN